MFWYDVLIIFSSQCVLDNRLMYKKLNSFVFKFFVNSSVMCTLSSWKFACFTTWTKLFETPFLDICQCAFKSWSWDISPKHLQRDCGFMLFQLWGELQRRKTRDLGLLFPGQTNRSSYHLSPYPWTVILEVSGCSILKNHLFTVKWLLTFLIVAMQGKTFLLYFCKNKILQFHDFLALCKGKSLQKRPKLVIREK